MLYHPDHDPVPRRLHPKQSDFMAHGTSDRCRVAGHQSVVAVHRATPRSVEFASREKSGRQRRSRPVFVPQPVEWVTLPLVVR